MSETVEIDSLFDDKDQLARIRQEAVFGRQEIDALISQLPPGSRVLEIGSGTGFLLASLAADYPELCFSGIEPVGAAFQAFDQVLLRIEAALPNLAIHRATIESYRPPEEYPGADLIFSVNVFEHLEDWRLGVDQAVRLLAPGGRAVILCPNYTIPYEPHFTIPLLFTPGLTRRVFSWRIEAVEKNLNAQGLWKSLNFITVPALSAHARRQGYCLSYDTGIMARMLARLDNDPEFIKRQRLLAPVARFLRRIGAAKLPPAISPYLKAIILRDKCSDHPTQFPFQSVSSNGGQKRNMPESKKIITAPTLCERTL